MHSFHRFLKDPGPQKQKDNNLQLNPTLTAEPVCKKDSAYARTPGFHLGSKI